jgi:hypothetical protein
MTARRALLLVAAWIAVTITGFPGCVGCLRWAVQP